MKTNQKTNIWYNK